MGKRFGNTRIRHPGVSGSPFPVRATSGGVRASWPGQNGQSGASAPGSSARAAKVTGRAARPAATITSCPLNGSWRSSDIAIRLRGRVGDGAPPAGP